MSELWADRIRPWGTTCATSRWKRSVSLVRSARSVGGPPSRCSLDYRDDVRDVSHLLLTALTRERLLSARRLGSPVLLSTSVGSVGPVFPPWPSTAMVAEATFGSSACIPPLLVQRRCLSIFTKGFTHARARARRPTAVASHRLLTDSRATARCTVRLLLLSADLTGR